MCCNGGSSICESVVMEDSPRPLSPAPEYKVVVDTPGWRKIKPRIPDTPQRRQLERQRSVREIVFGAKDGILTTMGVVTGVGVASGGRVQVLVSGLVALIAGALSMAVGEYQGAKSEREVVQASIDMERREMEANPADEFAEQVAYYKLKGFSADEAHMIVSRLAKNPEIYLYEMMRDEFGIDPRIAESSERQAGSCDRPLVCRRFARADRSVFFRALRLAGRRDRIAGIRVGGFIRYRVFCGIAQRAQSMAAGAGDCGLRLGRVRPLVLGGPFHPADIRPSACRFLSARNVKKSAAEAALNDKNERKTVSACGAFCRASTWRGHAFWICGTSFWSWRAWPWRREPV